MHFQNNGLVLLLKTMSYDTRLLLQLERMELDETFLVLMLCI